MDSDRKESQRARRAVENVSGTVLRATRRGALVLETENARRMMRRFAKLRSEAEQDGIDDTGAAPAQP